MSPPKRSAAQWLQLAHPIIQTKPDEAEAMIDRAIELTPRDPKAWYYRALVFHHARRDHLALEAFRKVAELDGGTAPALNGVVASLRRLGRNDEAKRVAESCRDKTHFNLQTGYADMFKNEDVAKAMELLLPCEKLARSDSERGTFHYNKACYESLMARHDDAIASLTKAIQLAPKYKAFAPSDPDFASMLSDPRFRALTS